MDVLISIILILGACCIQKKKVMHIKILYTFLLQSSNSSLNKLKVFTPRIFTVIFVKWNRHLSERWNILYLCKYEEQLDFFYLIFRIFFYMLFPMLLKPITISDIETELTFLQPNVFLVLLFVVDVDFILSILEKKNLYLQYPSL